MTLNSVEGRLPCQQILEAEDVGDDLVDLLGCLPWEALIAISLGPKQQVLGLDVLELDSSWRTCIEFRDVFSGVFRRGGTAIIVAHNDPSGSPSPRSADVEFAARLLEAGRLIGIDVLDHVIVTSRAWRSLKESTHLWSPGEEDSID